MNKATAEVYEREDGKWAWRLKAANGEIIATDGGQGYENKQDAQELVHNLVEGEYGHALAALRDTKDWVIEGHWIAEDGHLGTYVPGIGIEPNSTLAPLFDLTTLPGWNDLVRGILAGEIRAITPPAKP